MSLFAYLAALTLAGPAFAGVDIIQDEFSEKTTIVGENSNVQYALFASMSRLEFPPVGYSIRIDNWALQTTPNVAYFRGFPNPVTVTRIGNSLILPVDRVILRSGAPDGLTIRFGEGGSLKRLISADSIIEFLDAVDRHGPEWFKGY